MNLHEHQAREIFSRFGIPVPLGELASTPDQVEEIAGKLGGRVVVKAQVLVGGRGKAGGVKLANDAKEARVTAQSILGMEIRGEVVRKVLVAEAVEIAQELYLGMVIDRQVGRAALLVSALGGMDIEAVAKEKPAKILRIHIDPFLGLRDHQARELAMGIGLDRSLLRDFGAIAQALYRVFIESDASLAEVNPLAIDRQGKLRAVDAKLVVDDNALFRHPQFAALQGEGEDPGEAEARQHGLSYVKLNGNIGCLVNGAGLAMATMDVIKFFGGEPANFLDIGGGAREERVRHALRILLSDPQVEAVLVNIFGGITRCDEVARGLLAALQELKPEVPIVSRLVGTNQAEGRKILAEAKMITATSLAGGAEKVVEMAKSGKR